MTEPLALPELDDSSFADAVHRLLAVVRTQLGMQVAWVSEFIGSDQVLRFVDAEDGADAPEEGTTLPLGGSFCTRVLDGRFPGAIPDARGVPEAALLDVTAALHIGSYVGVPLLGPQGVANGMLCAISDRASPDLTERDVASMTLLAGVLHDLQKRALSHAEAARRHEALRFLVRAVVEGEGRHAVLQPIVDLVTGEAVAAEGLTRFTLPSPTGLDAAPPVLRSAAQWFDDAGRLGLRHELEVATAEAVLDLLEDGTTPDGVVVTVNLGPATLLSPALEPLLAGRPLDRVVVEISEHAPVSDYAGLVEALAPYRAVGLRLAVDDCGAGYASLRHVLATRPDMVKVDMALTRGADGDLARRTLLHALSTFADTVGCRLVAEGVETQAELTAVAACGVHLAQGYLLGKPSRDPRWSGFPAP